MVHLLMNVAIVEGVLRWLPALILLAGVHTALLSLVLTEVEAFCREHLGANRLLEVLVGEGAVTVQVKLVEDSNELLLGDGHAPELQEVFEFFLGDLSGLADVHVLERLPNRLPLKFDLLKDFVLDICAEENFGDLSPVHCLLRLVLHLQLLLELRIEHTVVPEVEALRHMDGVAEPFREVRVVELSLFLRVLVVHQLL